MKWEAPVIDYESNAKCLRNGCTNELTGRQRAYCSDKCRMKAKRQESRATASPVTPEVEQTRTELSLEPEHCSTLTKPEQALTQAMLDSLPSEAVNASDVHTRTTHEAGLCEQVDGVWQVA